MTRWPWCGLCHDSLSGEHSTVHPGTMTHRRRSILSCKRLPPCRNAPAGSPHPLCSSPHDEKLWHTPTRWSRYDATCVSREHSTVRPGMMTPVSLHHDAMYPPNMMPYRDDVPTYRYLARELLCIVEPCTHTLSSSRRLKSTMKEWKASNGSTVVDSDSTSDISTEAE
jgi:hypothetical protein